MKIHCLFEQSGTFKNEFKKLGFEAYDYDIQNKYDQTDFICNLYTEIYSASNGCKSLFDNISKDDLIIAFFPCIRFSVNVQLLFTCSTPQLKKWDIMRKLNYNMKLHNELSANYFLITLLVQICLEKDLKIIIENPYSKEHYLTKYWALKPAIIDLDRTKRGDLMKKPTQYWFINCSPKYNEVDEPINIKETHILEKDIGTPKRSLIHPDYARRFIKEFIL